MPVSVFTELKILRLLMPLISGKKIYALVCHKKKTVSMELRVRGVRLDIQRNVTSLFIIEISPILGVKRDEIVRAITLLCVGVPSIMALAVRKRNLKEKFQFLVLDFDVS